MPFLYVHGLNFGLLQISCAAQHFHGDHGAAAHPDGGWMLGEHLGDPDEVQRSRVSRLRPQHQVLPVDVFELLPFVWPILLLCLCESQQEDDGIGLVENTQATLKKLIPEIAQKKTTPINPLKNLKKSGQASNKQVTKKRTRSSSCRQFQS